MTTFIVAAALAALLALAFVLVPLFQTDPQVRNLKRRLRALAELAEDMEPSDYRQRRERLDADLAKVGGHSSNSGLIIGLALALPLATWLLYQSIGEPDGIVRGETEIEQIRDGLSLIARDLERNPDNTDNWIRLGMAYKDLREYSSAEHAYRRALYLDTDNTFVQVELAETLLFASDSPRLPEASRELLAEAVDADPENQKGLWLLGIGAFQNGEYEQALAWWRQLDDLLPPGSVQASVREQMARARARLSQAPETTPGLPSGHPPVVGSVIDDTSGVGPGAADNGDQPTFRVELSLSSTLTDALSGEETVFLIARAADGPSAPLAVLRLTTADLPATLFLSDSDAMVDGLSLFNFPEITLTARVSFSGTAEPQPGDLEGRTGPVSIAEMTYAELVISDRREE
ncbi:MAG: tetratricopeptide repeat protein [Wenzhouxiangella sp.]